jgi:lysophospholipase
MHIGGMALASVFLFSGLLPTAVAATKAGKTDLQISQHWKAGFQLLKDAGTDYFTRVSDTDSLKIGYHIIHHPHAKRVVVLVPGFAESPFKYSELIYDLHTAGFSIAALSLRAMGGSERYPRPRGMDPQLHRQTVHINDFEDYVSDLQHFVDEIVSDHFPTEDRYLFAHSTGGLVALAYLAKTPTHPIQSMVLNSPLLRLNLGTVSNAVLAIGSRLFDLGWAPLPARAVFDAKAAKFEDQTDTNHALRWKHYNDFLSQHPQFVQNNPSRGWIAEIKRATQPQAIESYAKAVNIPVLMLQAGRDSYVDTEGQNDLVALHQAHTFDRIRKIHFSDAFHSIWRGRDYDSVQSLVTKHFQ